MKIVIETISFILWIIYILLLVYRETRRKDIKKNIFHYIRLDSLLFLIIYLIYDYIARNAVLPYLYLIIVITNLVYLFYDLMDNYKYSSILKEELIYYIVIIIIILCLVISILISHKFLRLVPITLIVNLLIPSIITLINWVKGYKLKAK